MATNGKDIIVYRDGVAIAGTRSDNVRATAELLKKRTPLTGEAVEYTLSQTGWQVTTNYLVPAAANITALLQVGTTYTLVIGATGQTASTKKGLSGTAILQECNIVATLGNLMQGTFVFQGTGPLVNVQ